MKVAIFGATGGTSRITVRKALESGHEVTAAARNHRRSQKATNGCGL
jgi:uncharacterized protein YbjT (DUF2867 family)